MLSNYSNIFEIIILVNIFLLINVFIFYPLLINIFAKIFKKPLQLTTNYQPDITIIISAYNEEKLIEDAIESIYKSLYDSKKIKVLIGSDGSTDRTVEILEKLTKKYKSLKYFSFERIGKNAVLNKLSPMVDSEIIIYMDADIRLESESLTKLIEIFSVDNIGAVISTMNIINPDNDENIGKQGEYKYQAYEKQIRLNESLISSTVNSLGAFYGIRKKLYNPLPNSLVCDDLYPLYNVLIRKYRVVFTDLAIVNEVRGKSLNDEFSRRIRLASGGWSTISSCKSLLLPKYGWVSFFLWNHKILRWLSPVYLILIALSTFLISSDSWLFLPIITFQVLLYFGAILGWLLEKIRVNFFVTRIFLFIVSMNLGFLLGFFRFLLGGENSKWSRTVSN